MTETRTSVVDCVVNCVACDGTRTSVVDCIVNCVACDGDPYSCCRLYSELCRV